MKETAFKPEVARKRLLQILKKDPITPDDYIILTNLITGGKSESEKQAKRKTLIDAYSSMTTSEQEKALEKLVTAEIENSVRKRDSVTGKFQNQPLRNNSSPARIISDYELVKAQTEPSLPVIEAPQVLEDAIRQHDTTLKITPVKIPPIIKKAAQAANNALEAANQSPEERAAIIGFSFGLPIITKQITEYTTNPANKNTGRAINAAFVQCQKKDNVNLMCGAMYETLTGSKLEVTQPSVKATVETQSSVLTPKPKAPQAPRLVGQVLAVDRYQEIVIGLDSLKKYNNIITDKLRQGEDVDDFIQMSKNMIEKVKGAKKQLEDGALQAKLNEKARNNLKTVDQQLADFEKQTAAHEKAAEKISLSEFLSEGVQIVTKPGQGLSITIEKDEQTPIKIIEEDIPAQVEAPMAAKREGVYDIETYKQELRALRTIGGPTQEGIIAERHMMDWAGFKGLNIHDAYEARKSVLKESMPLMTPDEAMGVIQGNPTLLMHLQDKQKRAVSRGSGAKLLETTLTPDQLSAVPLSYRNDESFKGQDTSSTPDKAAVHARIKSGFEKLVEELQKEERAIPNSKGQKKSEEEVQEAVGGKLRSLVNGSDRVALFNIMALVNGFGFSPNKHLDFLKNAKEGQRFDAVSYGFKPGEWNPDGAGGTFKIENEPRDGALRKLLGFNQDYLQFPAVNNTKLGSIGKEVCQQYTEAAKLVAATLDPKGEEVAKREQAEQVARAKEKSDQMATKGMSSVGKWWYSFKQKQAEKAAAAKPVKDTPTSLEAQQIAADLIAKVREKAPEQHVKAPKPAQPIQPRRIPDPRRELYAMQKRQIEAQKTDESPKPKGPPHRKAVEERRKQDKQLKQER